MHVFVVAGSAHQPTDHGGACCRLQCENRKQYCGAEEHRVRRGYKSSAGRNDFFGLVSRPLSETERSEGFKTIDYARVGAVFAVHPSVPDDDVTYDDILQIHQGNKKTWSDGRKISVFIRGLHDSSNQVFFPLIPGFYEVINESINQKRWPIMYHDNDMANSLRSKEGAFGHTDTTEIIMNGGIKVLSVNGVEPSQENIRSGNYKYVKNLAFVYKGELQGRAKAFIDFVISTEGQAIIEKNGGVPVN